MSFFGMARQNRSICKGVNGVEWYVYRGPRAHALHKLSPGTHCCHHRLGAVGVPGLLLCSYHDCGQLDAVAVRACCVVHCEPHAAAGDLRGRRSSRGLRGVQVRGPAAARGRPRTPLRRRG